MTEESKMVPPGGLANADAATASPSVAGSPADHETGWLIEHRDDQRTAWLTLKPAEAMWGLSWTTESNEAVRFARRVDAEDYYAAHIDDAPNTFITEHVWTAPRGNVTSVETWDFDEGDLSIYTMEEGSPVFLFQPHELCDGDMIPWKEMVARARLAATAPELLSALKELYYRAVIGTDEERHAALHAAWVAIDKATGSDGDAKQSSTTDAGQVPRMNPDQFKATHP